MSVLVITAPFRRNEAPIRQAFPAKFEMAPRAYCVSEYQGSRGLLVVVSLASTYMSCGSSTRPSECFPCSPGMVWYSAQSSPASAGILDRHALLRCLAVRRSDLYAMVSSVGSTFRRRTARIEYEGLLVRRRHRVGHWSSLVEGTIGSWKTDSVRSVSGTGRI